MRSRRRAARLLLPPLLLSWLTGCQAPAQAPAQTPLPPKRAGVCEDLAYVFFLVARNKDQGRSETEQIAMARDGVVNPFASRPGTTLRYWEQVIAFVYRQPDADAETIREQVRERCSVDREGRAVLLWPRE